MNEPPSIATSHTTRTRLGEVRDEDKEIKHYRIGRHMATKRLRRPVDSSLAELRLAETNS